MSSAARSWGAANVAALAKPLRACQCNTRLIVERVGSNAPRASVAHVRFGSKRINQMASKEKDTDSVYRIVDVVGVSEKSWEDAGRRAVETAAGSLRDLRVAEVTKMDMRVEDGKVLAFRTRVALSFKYEA